MRKGIRQKAAGIVCCALMAAALTMVPASPLMISAEAHGHGSSHCGRGWRSSETSQDNYYYCGGHSAHYHSNGVCPYAETSVQPQTQVLPDTNRGTGWHHDEDGHWGYRCSDGTSLSGCWQQIDGDWYCFDGQGCMRTGWYSEDGSRYYLGSDGSMTKGSAIIGGREYTFDQNGKLVE